MVSEKSLDEDSMQEITIKVKAQPGLIKRFLKFLSMIAYASRVGHSSFFAIYIDGDGSDKISFEDVNLPEVKARVLSGDKLGSGGVEVAE